MPKQTVTFFDFKGGINTETNPINSSPTDVSEALNVEIRQDGSVARRNGLDYLSSNDDAFIYDAGFYDATLSSAFPFFDPPGTIFVTWLQDANPVDTDRTLPQRYMFAHIGSEIRVYLVDDAADLISPTNPVVVYQFSNDDAKYNKTQFIQNGKYVVAINKKTNPILFYLENGSFLIKNITISKRLTTNSVLTLNRQVTYTITDPVPGYGETMSPEEIKQWVDAKIIEIGYVAVNCTYTVKTYIEEVLDYGVDGQPSSWVTRHDITIYEYTDTVASNISDSVVVRGNFVYLCIQDHISSATTEPSVGEFWQDYWQFWGRNIYTGLSAWATSTAYESNVEPQDLTDNSFATGVFHAGRLWLTGKDDEPNTIYFSQVWNSEDYRQLGHCWQKADPYSITAISDSELVSDDGGTLKLTGATVVKGLVPYLSGLVVFAENGVWYLRSDSGFDATMFSMDKVTDHGIVAQNACLAIENAVVYTGKGDIFAIVATDNYANLAPQSLSVKIKSLYQDISEYNKSLISLSYNAAKQKLYVLYNEDDQDWQVDNNKFAVGTHYRNILIFDMIIKAWYRYSLSDDAVGVKPHIITMAAVDVPDLINTSLVLDNNDDFVIDDETNSVIYQSSSQKTSTTTDLFLIGRPNVNASVYGITFGSMEGVGFTDFALDPYYEESYTSQMITSHLLFGDAVHKKQWPYIFLMFNRVETGTVDANGVDSNPGGCQMRVRQNWAITSSGMKYGDLKDVYFPDRYTYSFIDGANPGEEVVWHKMKLRSRGHSVQLEFVNDADKDFHLYGFQMAHDPNTNY